MPKALYKSGWEVDVTRLRQAPLLSTTIDRYTAVPYLRCCSQV